MTREVLLSRLRSGTLLALIRIGKSRRARFDHPDMLTLAVLLCAPEALSMAVSSVIEPSASPTFRYAPIHSPVTGAGPLVGKSLRLWDVSEPKHVRSPMQMLAKCITVASPRDVTLVGVATNILLSGLKAGVGVTINSASLIADAGHSLSDLVSDGLALCAASRPDIEHFCTYGIALMLGLTGLGMMYHSLSLFLVMWSMGATCGAATSTVLHAAGFFIALVSIASKEVLFHVTHRVGKRCGSSTLIANAFHHRSDAMSSVATAVGTCGTLIGFHAIDSLAALAVGCMVLRMGFEVATGDHH